MKLHLIVALLSSAVSALTASAAVSFADFQGKFTAIDPGWNEVGGDAHWTISPDSNGPGNAFTIISLSGDASVPIGIQRDTTVLSNWSLTTDIGIRAANFGNILALTTGSFHTGYLETGIDVKAGSHDVRLTLRNNVYESNSDDLDSRLFYFASVDGTPLNGGNALQNWGPSLEDFFTEADAQSQNGHFIDDLLLWTSIQISGSPSGNINFSIQGFDLLNVNVAGNVDASSISIYNIGHGEEYSVNYRNLVLSGQPSSAVAVPEPSAYSAAAATGLLLLASIQIRRRKNC